MLGTMCTPCQYVRPLVYTGYPGRVIALKVAPGTSRSSRTAIEDLHLERLWVVYPGAEEYALDKRTSVVPLDQAARIAAQLPVP